MGRFYYQGSIHDVLGGAASGGEGFGYVPRNFKQARVYFLEVARQLWPPLSLKDNATPNPHLTKHENYDDSTGVLASMAAGYLGRMYLRGEGVRAPDAKVAKMWFERGYEFGDPECGNGLGIIWRDGLVEGRVDEVKANGFFKQAAGHDLAEAQVNLGKYYYSTFSFLSSSVVFGFFLMDGLCDRAPRLFNSRYIFRNRHASRLPPRSILLPSKHPRRPSPPPFIL